MSPVVVQRLLFVRDNEGWQPFLREIGIQGEGEGKGKAWPYGEHRDTESTDEVRDCFETQCPLCLCALCTATPSPVPGRALLPLEELREHPARRVVLPRLALRRLDSHVDERLLGNTVGRIDREDVPELGFGALLQARSL